LLRWILKKALCSLTYLINTGAGYTLLKKYNNACALKNYFSWTVPGKFIIDNRAMKILSGAITVRWQVYSVAFNSN
jgi:hypothetical protein